MFEKVNAGHPDKMAEKQPLSNTKGVPICNKTLKTKTYICFINNFDYFCKGKDKTMEKEFNNNESEQKVPQNLSEQLCAMYEQLPKREKKSWKSWKDFNAECRLDMTAPDKPDNSRFNVGGVKIAHEGSIVSVGATQWYVMTDFLVALASVMIGGRPFGNIERETQPKKILWVDNCRDEEDLVEIIWKVYQLAGIHEDTPLEEAGLYVLPLQDCFIDERGAFIQGAINGLNPDVVIIDNVEALLYDYMSVKESHCVVEWFKRNKHNRTIFATMRTNERNNRKSGHLGTELGIKSYDELTIIKKGGRYEVVHESNGRPIREQIAFKIDKDGLPVPVEVKTAAAPPAEKRKMGFDFLPM